MFRNELAPIFFIPSCLKGAFYEIWVTNIYNFIFSNQKYIQNMIFIDCFLSIYPKPRYLYVYVQKYIQTQQIYVFLQENTSKKSMFIDLFDYIRGHDVL